jgi:hypothetical protein
MTIIETLDDCSTVVSQVVANYAVVVFRCFDDRWYVASTAASHVPLTGKRTFNRTVRLPNEHTRRNVPRFLTTHPPLTVEHIQTAESPDAAARTAAEIAIQLQAEFGRNRVHCEPRPGMNVTEHVDQGPFPAFRGWADIDILRPRNLRRSV